MPERFTQLTSRTFVLPQASIDTDQIIPARFLTTTTKSGLGAMAFHDWRFNEAGEPTDHPLNTLDAASHRILVAGDNFACGSSREHAPWALIDYGFRVVISSSIADIFTSNALKNGLLPITIDRNALDQLMSAPGILVCIDLEDCTMHIGDGPPLTFSVEAFARRCLIEGVDALGWLTERIPAIETFEGQQGLAQ